MRLGLDTAATLRFGLDKNNAAMKINKGDENNGCEITD